MGLLLLNVRTSILWTIVYHLSFFWRRFHFRSWLAYLVYLSFFLHTMHLIIYTIFIDKWKEKQKGNLEHFSYHNQVYYNIPISSFHSLYNTTVWQIHLDFYSGCYLQLIFWYIHDDVVQTLPILDRQYQMLFYLSFLCNCYHFSCVYSHLINHKVLLIIRVD